ncbi:hypothetical protein C8F01DRAFT_576983 [Mycena amicta]|nr:hypothetical protein C8F01DRAFT_576983 [Mycena amicta]
MMSWFNRHRPRRRKEAPLKSDAVLVSTSTAKDSDSEGPPLFRRNPRRQDTDATLVNDDLSSECSTPRTSFFDKRCASPTLFDSPPPSPLHDHKALPPSESDDPTFWKTLHQHGAESRYFGPVVLNSERPAKVHRSRLAKVASGTTHSITAILEASVVIGEASNLPYLKGLAGIILLVSNSVQATEDNKVDCARLFQMVLDIATIAARNLDDPQYHQALESVQRACTHIEQAISASCSRSYARRFLEASNERELLVQCEKELQHCLDVFQVRFHLATSVSVTRRNILEDKFATEVLDILEPVKHVLKESQIPESVIDETFEEEYDAAEHLPPAPQIFYGRENQLRALVDLFTPPSFSSNNPFKVPAQASAATTLLGQPGSGKSALALRLVHHPKVVDKFAGGRIWVGCTNGMEFEDVLRRLAGTLGTTTHSDNCSKLKETVLAALGRAEKPRLVVFDDLDNVWDTDSPKTKLAVEDLLTGISDLPNVSLLVTLRGTQRPLGPAYSKSAIAPLGGISPASAQEMFVDVSGLDDYNTDIVDELLSLVGHHPLAITLLAQKAQFEPVDFLLDRFRAEGTAMLASEDDDDVVGGLDAVIEKSLTSARMRECPAALDVLRVLSRTPEGISKAEVSARVGASETNINIPGAMVNKCLSVLHKTSLAIVVQAPGNPQERVKVPEVVRLYLEKHAHTMD